PPHLLDHPHGTTTAPAPHRPRPGTPTGTTRETDHPPPIKEEAPPHVSAARLPAVVYVLRVWPALRARAEQWLLCRVPADTAPDRARDPVRAGAGTEHGARLRRRMATPVPAWSAAPAVVLRLWTNRRAGGRSLPRSMAARGTRQAGTAGGHRRGVPMVQR